MITRENWYNLSAKADWEGGWPEFILNYGVPNDWIDDQEFGVAIDALVQAWTVLSSLIEAHIDKYGEYANE